MTWSWLWLGVFLLAVILEAVTDKKLFIWFIPASLVAAVIDFIPDTIIIQLILFASISILGILSKRIVAFIKTSKEEKYDIDAVVGERCIVVDRIDGHAGRGHVKVKGQVYAARGLYDDDVFESGEALRVVAIEGVKLICKRDA